MTTFYSPWRWNPVAGQYDRAASQIRSGSGEISAIEQFRNSTIFLFGATGFVGKVLLATLLDRFPDLKQLVIQVRRKRFATGEQRFYGEILKSPALQPVLGRFGESGIRQRVTILEGDLCDRLCGLTPEQVSALKGNIDVIVNTAGLVEFDPPLDDSLITNVYGIQHLIELAQLLETKLVHISTCYVVGKKSGRISEDEPIVGSYPYRKGPEDKRFDVNEELAHCEEYICQVAGVSDPDRRSRIMEGVTRDRHIREKLAAGGMKRAESFGWINTYTYTKSMGEQLIASTPGLRYCIVRPAIVESAIRLPFPGWNEGLTTSAPLVLMGGEGVKSWPVRRDGPLEIIPVDLVAAGILIATAATLAEKNEPVYQLATAFDNPVMLPRLVAFLGMNSRYKHKHKKTGNKPANFWKTYIETRVVSVEQLETRRKRLHAGLDFIHASLILLKSIFGNDLAGPYLKNLRITRRQIRQQEQTLDKFLPFMIHNSFVFETKNIRNASNRLTDEDRDRLRWDPEDIDWADYWVNIHTKGIERWIRPVFTKTRGED